jgi:replicative DNA helicase
MANQGRTLHAERAVIGTLLAQNEQRSAVLELRAEDFSDAVYQAVFRALVAVQGQESGTGEADLIDRVVARADLPAVSADELSGLVADRPTAEDAAVYARIVQEMGLRRDLGRHSERIAALADRSRAGGEDQDHLRRLSRALLQSGLRTPLAGTPGEASVTDAAEWQPGLGEVLLADVLQHPEILEEVRDWLDPVCFTSDLDRQIYAAVLAVADAGEVVDERTVATELDRRNRVQGGQAPDAVLLPDAAIRSAYLARLASARVEIGDALEAGRDLLTDHTRTELAAEAERAIAQQQSNTQPRQARGVPSRRTITHREPSRGPELLQPHPQIGPDGPTMRF